MYEVFSVLVAWLREAGATQVAAFLLLVVLFLAAAFLIGWLIVS